MSCLIAANKIAKSKRALLGSTGKSIWTSTLPLVVAIQVMVSAATSLQAEEKLGIRVPDGFEASHFADDDLAHDIYSMTIDARGRIVVSGPGYVRILIDDDGDGRADRFQQFADGPKTGAQGMFFLGNDLLCIGDEGLLRYRDSDGDGRADGSPDVFLKLKTGSEHHVHSIQKGPDGWWYLIAGNFAGIDSKYVTSPNSPVKKPGNGVLMRLKPDLSGGEVVADGLRNAYDFAFNRQGDVFTHDSDGERDVSLPWYRPTRVFHLTPGSFAGWISRSWKHPNDFFEMPPTVASFGRGSPTGVVCYQHNQFPEEYHDALFALDWTYGRVLALPLEKEGATWTSKPIDFMRGVGQFGFAPTDIEVGPEGSLFVCVGGRGTRGSVFRVSAKSRDDDAENASESDQDQLNACLNAPQPLSSWSRAKWVPAARQLGKQAFLNACLNDDLSEAERVRAVEILTEMYGGLDDAAIRSLSMADTASLRARTVWSVGRTRTNDPDPELVRLFLNDEDPHVVRATLEALLGVADGYEFKPLIELLVKQLGSSDANVRRAASRLIPKLSDNEFRDVSLAVSSSTWQTGVANALGYVGRKPGFNKYAHQIGLLVLADDHPPELKREAVLLLQLGLGGVFPNGKSPPVFDGYSSPLDLSEHERELDTIRIAVADAFPSGNADLDWELARLIAMITPYNPTLLEQLLAKISDESEPVHDIHYLIAAARIPVDRSRDRLNSIAKAFLGLEKKIQERDLKQDSNWNDRISELYAVHVKLGPTLPTIMASQEDFGQPGHVLFLSELSEEHIQAAMDAFAKRISETKNYPWNTDVVFLLGASANSAHRAMIVDLYEEFSLRDAVLMVLAETPEPAHREKFVTGLESSQSNVLEACLNALEKLPPSDNAHEQVLLLRTARRLGTDKQEYPLREQVVRLMQRNSGETFGYVVGEEGYKPQPEAIAKWTEYLTSEWPEEWAQQTGASADELSHLKELLAAVDWSVGDAQRGEQLFVKRQCAQCHGSRSALGPDLTGVSRRFSRDDLFTAIVQPNRDVSPRYQTTLVETVEGQVYTGLVIYESVDGLILRNGQNQTFRIENEDVEFRRRLSTSLMPKGLLKDLKSQDLADLYRYLNEMSAATSTADAGQEERK